MTSSSSQAGGGQAKGDQQGRHQQRRRTAQPILREAAAGTAAAATVSFLRASRRTSRRRPGHIMPPTIRVAGTTQLKAGVRLPSPACAIPRACAYRPPISSFMGQSSSKGVEAPSIDSPVQVRIIPLIYVTSCEQVRSTFCTAHVVNRFFLELSNENNKSFGKLFNVCAMPLVPSCRHVPRASPAPTWVQRPKSQPPLPQRQRRLPSLLLDDSGESMSVHGR